MNEKYAVKVLSSDATSYTLGGYGVVFGGEDLVGDTFTKETDFWLTHFPNPVVLYQHGMDSSVRKSVLGRATVKVDDIGLWVESQIQLSHQYAQAVRELADQGIIGYSSGSIPHLVEREGKVIKSWPAPEFSLTPTPCEPRTLGVSELRSLVADEPEVEAVLPKDGSTPSAAATKGEPATVSDKTSVNERTMKMELTQEQIGTMMQDAITKALENMPAFQKAMHVSPDGVDQHPDETKSFANFLVSVQRHDVKRLTEVYKTALAQTSGATGGYMVPVEYASEILRIATEKSVIRPHAFVIPDIDGEYDAPALYNGGGAAGTPASLAGVVAYWTAEAGTKTESEPSFDIIKLAPQELSGYSLASNKIMRGKNGAALESTLKQLFGEAVAWYEDYAFLRGTGSGQPLGIFNSPCLEYTSEIATDSTIVLADIAEMLGYFLPSAWSGARWIVSTDVMAQLVTLVAASSGNLVWMPGNVNADPSDTGLRLFGKPVMFSEKMNTIPDVQNEQGGLLLANLKYYLIGDGIGGLSIDFSEHVKFLTNQSAWRFTIDVDGQPWLKNTITLANGKTVSPFVTTHGPA